MRNKSQETLGTQRSLPKVASTFRESNKGHPFDELDQVEPAADHSPLGRRSQIEDTLPYPELFDRSERTFAATFAKFRDLSYFTPVQRIAVYMDFSERLKKQHLLDLISYMKVSKHTVAANKVTDEDDIKNEEALQEYLKHSIYLGLMPQESQ